MGHGLAARQQTASTQERQQTEQNAKLIFGSVFHRASASPVAVSDLAVPNPGWQMIETQIIGGLGHFGKTKRGCGYKWRPPGRVFGRFTGKFEFFEKADLAPPAGQERPPSGRPQGNRVPKRPIASSSHMENQALRTPTTSHAHSDVARLSMREPRPLEVHAASRDLPGGNGSNGDPDGLSSASSLVRRPAGIARR